MKYIEINFQTRVFLPVRVIPFLPVWTIYIYDKRFRLQLLIRQQKKVQEFDRQQTDSCN